MVDKNIYAFIGLAAKANKLISGNYLCENALIYKSVKMVIIAQDANEGTVKKFENICKKKSINPIRFGYKEELGKIIGKTGSRSVLCITCSHFAGRLHEMIVVE